MPVYRGKVIKIDTSGVYVEIADLGVGMVFGPCESIVSPVVVDSFVLCMQVDGAKEDIVVVGILVYDQTEIVANYGNTQVDTHLGGDATNLVQTVASKATITALNSGLDTKENKVTAGTTAQYWRGDKTWQTLPAATPSEPPIATGLTTQYWRGDKTWQTLPTASPSEPPLPTGGTTSQYLRGDKSWQVLTASVVASTASGNVGATNVQGAINELAAEKEPSIAAGSTTQYWRGDKTWQTLPSAAPSEPPIAAGNTSQYWRGDKTWQTLPGQPAIVTETSDAASWVWSAGWAQYDDTNNRISYDRVGKVHVLQGTLRRTGASITVSGSVTVLDVSASAFVVLPPFTVNSVSALNVSDTTSRVFLNSAGVMTVQFIRNPPVSSTATLAIASGEYIPFLLTWIA